MSLLGVLAGAGDLPRSSRRESRRAPGRPRTNTPRRSSVFGLTAGTVTPREARVASNHMEEPQKDGSAAGLTRGRRLLVLAICCFSLLMVGLDTTIVNVALPAIRKDRARVAVGPAVDDRRLHAGARQPADARRARPPIESGASAFSGSGLVVFSLGSLLCALAPTPGAPDRRARPPGDRRLDAQPGGDVDHPQRVRGPAGASTGHRRLGRRVRAQHGARACASAAR